MSTLQQYGAVMPRVLICGSDPTLNNQILTTIDRLEATAEVVTGRTHALTILQKYPFDLVLVDESFAEDGGYGFARQVRQSGQWQDLPIMLVIGDNQSETVEQAYINGASDFVCKPLDSIVLFHRLKHLLANHRSKQAFVAHQDYLDKFDTLTGLFNRQYFSKMLQRSMERTAQQKKVSALLLIDIDNFKRINSSFNYRYGDSLLKEVAQRLAGSLRGTDLISRVSGKENPYQGLARLGGDEFTLFVENVGSNENATSVAKRCIENISEPLELHGQNVVLTGSVGIALYPQDGSSVDTLMKNAERAMYAAKEQGGGCFTCYSQEMNVSDESSFILESDLRDAIQNEQLALHYQPQIDTQSGNVVGLEVLLRWHHPMLGMVSPERFIPIAESSGLIVPIGDWVLESACIQARKWIEAGKCLEHVAVNVSAYQFHRQDFVSKTIDILKRTGLPARHLELELTESLLMSDAEENIAKLAELKAEGIRLAVDDFGTGYSSLSYLKKLPIDTLKIDRSFVSNIDEGDTEGAIVGAILALAGKLELEVVAEGVEDIHQMEFLKRNQCGLLQGFLFSPAKPAEEVETLLNMTYVCEADSIQLVRRKDTQAA